MKRYVIIVLIILAMGIAKWPIESSILRDRKDNKYGGKRLSGDIREQVPQFFFLALLGGFRGVVSDIIWIRAHGAWEKQEWFNIKRYFNLVTTLQPMSVLYWETSAWHMAWNISYSVSQDPREARASKRELARRQWIEEGKKFLEKGVENVPERYDLYFHSGWLIMQKQDYIDADPEAGYPGKHFVEAAEWFKKTWQKFPDEAPTYVSRMAGHCYMKAAEAAVTASDPDREKQYWQMARDWWVTLWSEDHSQRPDQMWHKIEEWGRQCEDNLKLPPADRKFPVRPA